MLILSHESRNLQLLLQVYILQTIDDGGRSSCRAGMLDENATERSYELWVMSYEL